MVRVRNVSKDSGKNSNYEPRSIPRKPVHSTAARAHCGVVTSPMTGYSSQERGLSEQLH